MLKCLFFALGLIALPVLAATSPQASPPKALFYLSREEKSVRSFLAHADQIDILVPNWYAVDGNGDVTGSADPHILDAAKRHRIAVMPLVTNSNFVQEDVHNLLAHPQRHASIFAALVRTARENGYAGLQLDFENVPSSDRDDRAASVYFYRDQVREWIFYTDRRTIGERYDLVKERNLAGFASWVLGSEDPAIWELLPARGSNAAQAAKKRH